MVIADLPASGGAGKIGVDSPANPDSDSDE